MENKQSIRWEKIALSLKIGILGAVIILAGDLLMGWGVKDLSQSGLAAQLSPYLTISEGRMFWAAVFGFTGVPLAVAGHFGIHQLLRPYSRKYARLYAVGNITFLIFGGAGVHVSSVEAAFFYQSMSAAGAETAAASTMKFALYFLVPLYAVLLTGWFLMVYAHLRAVAGGLSPYPRWCWIFSMPVGTLLFSLIGLLGNHAFVNAVMVGAFSLGNIWSLGGHLWMLRRAKEAHENRLGTPSAEF